MSVLSHDNKFSVLLGSDLRGNVNKAVLQPQFVTRISGVFFLSDSVAVVGNNVFLAML